MNLEELRSAIFGGRAGPLGLLFLLVAAAALAFGTFARFDGLGTWPLAIDEYYLARSVENLLRAGLPAYACGGYYTRGIALQYLAALLQLAGASPELSIRLIAAVASLAALPAVYLLGRRIHGPVVGLAAVALVAVSLWEVEMARFGRMYAPFQAVFLWYLVYFLRYTIDRETRALRGMVVLTVAGTLIWEGGALLALANLIPPFFANASGRLSRADWRYLAGAGVLFVAIALYVTTDLRYSTPEPVVAADFDRSESAQALAAAREAHAPWTTLLRYPAWTLAAIPLLGIGVYALRWTWRFRDRWLVALGLAAALGAALLQQFSATATVLALLLAAGLLRWRELLERAALPYFVAIAASAAFWTAFGLSTSAWDAHVTADSWLGGNRALRLVYEFLRFPDYVREIFVPWRRAVPVLGLGLVLLIAAGALRSIAREERTAGRALLVVLLALAAAASASDPPRHETRYLFFLYPVALLLATATVANAAGALRRPWAPVMGAFAALVLFSLSEDFRPRHLAAVDSAEANFRLGYRPELAVHLHGRSDMRGAGRWLARHAASADHTLINAYPGVDFYFRGFDYTYIDRSHPRYVAYACRQGTVERWGNFPLIDSMRGLEARIADGERAFVVLDRRLLGELTTRFADRRPRVAWTSIDGSVNILELDGRPRALTQAEHEPPAAR